MQNVIAGSIFIFERITHALFDISSSRSFISATYVKMFELVVEVLDEPVYVIIPVKNI